MRHLSRASAQLPRLPLTGCRGLPRRLRTSNRPVRHAPQSEWIAAINGGAQEGLREGLRAIGIDTTQYEFVTALAEAFEDADCVRRHDAGEPVFGSAVRL